MPNLKAIKVNGVVYEIEGGGGSGTVTGVKGNAETTYRTGNVNLTPANIGALPDTTSIPTKTSDLTNDSGYYSESDTAETTLDDADKIPFYDNSASTTSKRRNTTWLNVKAKLKTYFDTLYTKVASSTTNGNIKINGTETTVYTLPSNVVKDSSYVHTDNNYTTAEKNKVDSLNDLAYIAKDGTSSTKYLKGDGTWATFPTIPTVGNGTLTIQRNGTTLKTFSANQSGDDTVNITVPTTASDVNAVKYDGDLTSLGSGANATPTKAYFDNYVNNNKVEIAFDSMTPDYTIIFGRGASNTDNGNILKYGITDKYLRILRKIGGNWQSEDWEKISAGYADTAGSASSATSANQLATARNINLGSDFTGSASFNGSSDITINGNFYYANCSSGNTANYPWHRIAKVEGQTGQWVDKEALLLIRGGFNSGALGLIKIALRTNATGNACTVSAKWLYRYSLNENDVAIAHWGTTGQSVYADVFLKRGQYARTVVYQVVGGRSFTLVGSSEANDTTASDKKTSYEVYKTVASAGTEIHSQAYTSTVEAEDGGNVAYAKNAGTVNGKTVEENVPSGAKFTDTTYNFSGNTFYSGDQNNSEHNANNAIKNGHYYYTSNGPTTSIGASGNDGALYVQQYSDSWVAQIAQDYRNGNLFVRGKNNGTWQSWKKIANSADIPTALSQLTSDSNHRTVTDAQIATFSGNAQWGGITGNIANQGDLQNELDLKLDKTGGNVGPLTVENEWSSGEIESATYQSDGIRLHYSGNAFQSAYTVWLGGEVLWTNPSLTADFAQQTITLARELSHYEYYEVVAKRAKGNPQFLSTGLIPVKDASDGGITSRIYNSAECNYMRQFNTEHSTGTSFKISTCGKFATYGSTNQTTANSYIIPWQVIGFRFICGV